MTITSTHGHDLLATAISASGVTVPSSSSPPPSSSSSLSSSSLSSTSSSSSSSVTMTATAITTATTTVFITSTSTSTTTTVSASVTVSAVALAEVNSPKDSNINHAIVCDNNNGSDNECFVEADFDPNGEFPVEKLNILEEKVDSFLWSVAIMPIEELNHLLRISIELCKKGLDTSNEHCQRFYHNVLIKVLVRIITDDSVANWKPSILDQIIDNCLLLIDLVVLKLDDDAFIGHEFMALLFNPMNRFHIQNATRSSETVKYDQNLSEEDLFARPSNELHMLNGVLVDFINEFGMKNGFVKLYERFQNSNSKPISLSMVASLICPFMYCNEYMTTHTLTKYIMPILELIPNIMLKLSDEDLKKDLKSETKNDTAADIIKMAKNLCLRVPDQLELVRTFEEVRLKMILRQLQMSTFNGKMNALNEINKIIQNLQSYYPSRNLNSDTFTTQFVAQWIDDNHVLEIVLKDSLHQPQYVDKLEKIIRFMLKEQTLSLPNLDALWEAQSGKHEAIVKNVHDLLAKLAWDFTGEQLDYLFECFKRSFTIANKKQQERLLELIRKLAEDDKHGVMASKVLKLFWNLSHSPDTPTDIVDQALCAHVKILDYNCSQDRDSQKAKWLEKCINELKSGDDSWVLLALKEMREIICVYESSITSSQTHRTMQSPFSRYEIVVRLINQYDLLSLLVDNLVTYMEHIRNLINSGEKIDENYCNDGRFPHMIQVQERLSFIRFIQRECNTFLLVSHAKQIWQTLAENAVFPVDREMCFKWFSDIMTEDDEFDPEYRRSFFEETILKLDPVLLSETGLHCFQHFFRIVNMDERNLMLKKGCYILQNSNLVGIDYLWSVIVSSDDPVALKAIEIMKEVHMYTWNRAYFKIIHIHEQFIKDCLAQMSDHYEQIKMLLMSITDDSDIQVNEKIQQSAKKIFRVIQLLLDYVNDCDMNYNNERKLVPLHRAFRGRSMMVYVRFPCQGRQTEDYNFFTHLNDTVMGLKRLILRKMKMNNVKIDLYLMNDVIDENDDHKLLNSLGITDKTFLNGKLTPLSTHMASSAESSSDESLQVSPKTCYISVDVCNNNNVSNIDDNADSTLDYYSNNLNQNNNGPSGTTSIAATSVTASTFAPQSELGSQSQSQSQQQSFDSEMLLPGVIMSKSHENFEFLWNLAIISNQINNQDLCTSCFELLSLLPADKVVVDDIYELLSFERILQRTQSPTQALYYLQVLYSLLLPAANDLFDSNLVKYQVLFLKTCKKNFIEILTSNESLLFEHIDYATKKRILLVTLKLCKFVFNVILSNAKQLMMDDQVLFSAIYSLSSHLSMDFCTKPDDEVIMSLLRFGWSSAFGVLHFDAIDFVDLHELCLQSVSNTNHMTDVEVEMCREIFECFTAAALLAMDSFARVVHEDYWKLFLQDMILMNNQSTVRLIVINQIFRLCTQENSCLLKTISYLFILLDTVVPTKSAQSYEYFQLFGRLISCADHPLDEIPELVELLHNVIAWLRNVKTSVVDSILLEGYLCLARELICCFENTNSLPLKEFVTELLLDFIFPASKIKHTILSKENFIKDLVNFNIESICNTGSTLSAAFDLLLAIFAVNVDLFEHAVHILIELFYSDSEPVLTEWEYLPPIGVRPLDGFVGLKNAGATCYMNSVLQQLFMIPTIRESILSCEGAVGENFDSIDGDDEMRHDTEFEEKMLADDSRKEYNIEILKQVQVIFGHLLYSRLQYFVPKGLWRYFRLQGEPVNLREQQDAVEFFMSLIDSVDEALKSLNHEQIMNKILGGLYSDQKICKDCPHRYSREEPFCVISVDIRNQNKLEDSLEQYVKGELLEGADAYYCDKCSCKVVTVKRLCVKKLPPVLAIQLKRFEYDFERVCAIKFNDYFEFPRDLDMEPYTVNGLAKIEGEIIDWDTTIIDECTKYSLTGIVVHSGQASGGHYFSYICNRDKFGDVKWYKFDDGEVTEFRMDDDELRAQCFGGDYMSSYFEPSVKRGSIRRQKRWWNAYMLFYTRVDCFDNQLEQLVENMSIDDDNNRLSIKIPLAIERSILIENIEFLHERSQFTSEYFAFMQRLGIRFSPHNQEPIKNFSDRYPIYTMKLLSKFLFYTGFRTKKSLRGSTIDWFEILFTYMSPWRCVCESFCSEILSKSKQNILREYLLICPNDVRNVFIKLVVFVLQILGTDHIQTKQVLDSVFGLLKNAVHEGTQNVSNYSQFFYSYATVGPDCRKLLLDMKLATFFIILTMEDNLPNNYPYQYIEFGKIHQIVSILVRSCDVAHLTHSSSSLISLRNIYYESGRPVIQLPNNLQELVFNRTTYIKRVIDDSTLNEESIKFIQFCCWENQNFTHVVLSEILWKINVSNYQDFKVLLEYLMSILQIPDSWQLQRLYKIMRGIPDERDGLLDCVLKNTSHYQKKSYLAIKCIVQFFISHKDIYNIMYALSDMRTKWLQALKWLNDELSSNKSNRTMNYGGYNWPGSIQSNDNSSGHYLERSGSARRVLEKAYELCPSDSDNEDLSDRERDNLINENIENSERSDTSSSPPTSATVVPSSSSPTLN